MPSAPLSRASRIAIQVAFLLCLKGPPQKKRTHWLMEIVHYLLILMVPNAFGMFKCIFNQFWMENSNPRGNFIHQSHGIFFGHQKFRWSHPSTEESNFTLCSAVGLWLVVSGFPVSIPYRIHTANIGGKDSSIWMGTFPKCLVIWGMTSDVPSLQSDLFLLPRCPRLVKINKI